ncbi:hypothetical protein IVA80_15365 [Bradyrhizobium sp. 139]|uniref:hypothetical protein n=1 Tax=Bradyrhizobium sp. 139 TaxID=2782616 RepID=UPI001FF956B1|nr:hypothetical protein [Bradyrhizobium sp. 139]MCK1742203.1 hypothetical protein [Bradyrhizobium sp. 139]
MIIKPTVGRVVYYWPDTQQDLAALAGQPLAAHISAVWSDVCVNLMVIDANGNSHSRTSVLFYQEGAMDRPAETFAFAEWMPYQTGQAAKTEKLQAQLEAKTA